jgi:hypothetical protein
VSKLASTLSDVAHAERVSSLIDEFLESYLYWRDAAADVHSAYQCWGACDPPQRVLGFESYRAALDREEHAASVHCASTERLRDSQR